jgi:Ca2+-binding EF-hand superfamily protein
MRIIRVKLSILKFNLACYFSKGTIDFAEFVIAYIATMEGTKREKFEYAFEVYDINDDQVIEKKEIKKILNLICRILGLSDAEAQSYTETIMVSFDTNHDKVITKNEFIDGCLHDATLAKISNPFNL